MRTITVTDDEYRALVRAANIGWDRIHELADKHHVPCDEYDARELDGLMKRLEKR